MGIVETDLAEFELSELGPCAIERDASGVIHLHLGRFRLELTLEEFDQLVTVVERGRAELDEIKRADAERVSTRGNRGRASRASGGPRELSDEARGALLDTFGALQGRGIPYVVLRGFGDLPDRIDGSDVDLLVDAARFDEAVAVVRDRFAPAESKLANALAAASYGARNPLLGARTLVESPDEVASYLRRRLVASDLGGRGYIERAFERDGLVVHLVNHLAYPSPMDGSLIRVSDEVDGGMLERRVRHDDWFVPAPADELAHLVCRGVFDYAGTFPHRYAVRCDELRAAVFGEPPSGRTFETVLSHLFYGAAPLVADLVRRGEYDAIRPGLACYDCY